MGNRRMGLSRLEALLEKVDRDLNLENSTLTNATITSAASIDCSGALVIDGASTLTGKVTATAGVLNGNIVEQSGTTAEDLTATAANLVWYSNAAQAGAITLPQATAANAGMVIKIIVGTTAWSTTAFKLGFANGGSTVMCGQILIGTSDGTASDTRSFVITASAKSLEIDSADVTLAGGDHGSMYTFTYLEANLVHCDARGMITTGDAAPVAAASTTSGTS